MSVVAPETNDEVRLDCVWDSCQSQDAITFERSVVCECNVGT